MTTNEIVNELKAAVVRQKAEEDKKEVLKEKLFKQIAVCEAAAVVVIKLRRELDLSIGVE